MENIILKYSELIQNDGGFDQVRSDLDDLEKDLKDKARKLKGVFDLSEIFNTEKLKSFEEDTEGLEKAFKGLADTRASVSKIEEEYRKVLKKSQGTQEDQIDILVELDKQLVEQRLALIKINSSVKAGTKTEKQANKERVKSQIEIKKIQKEIRKQQKEVLEMNDLSKKEQKLIKAKIVLDKEQVKSLSDVRERIAALRVVVQSLDFEEESEKIAAFNQEINDLTEVLGANSDKFIQSKINVGNYEESILNALNQTSAFSTGVGFLDGAISSLLKALTLNTEELDAMQESLGKNTGALKKLTIGFGRLNKALKASIIGVIIVALTALVSLFGDTRAGAIRLEKVMNTLSTVFTTFGQVARIAINGAVSNITNIVKILGGLGKAIVAVASGNIFSINEAFKNLGTDAEGAIDGIKKTWEEFVAAFELGAEAVIAGLENIEAAFRIQDEIRKLERELGRLNGQYALLQQIADDSTKSLGGQLAANRRALLVAEEIARREVGIEKLRLEEVNERIKQNVKANVEEAKRLDLSLKGVPFAEKTLQLAKARGAQLEISNELLEEQQAAVLALIAAENDRDLTFAENAQKRREIERDLFEQNLDLLIDLIDTEKNLSEQFVNDATKNFQSRVTEFNRFIRKFRANAQSELNEFTKFAKKTGEDLDFQVEFDENGDVKVFVNDIELATDNVVELNAQLQGLGISEIPINRLREFVVEARNGVRDFRELNKELRLTAIRINELFNNLAVDQVEIEALDILINKIRQLRLIDLGNVPRSERIRVLKELEELEKEREELELRFSRKRDDNRLDAINEELKLVEEGSERELELLREKAVLEKKIRDSSFGQASDELEEELKKQERLYKEFIARITRIIDLIGKAFADNARKQTKESELSLSKQEDATDIQRRRAEAGLENTLKFEQEQLGKREAELLKRQKREAQIQKLQSFWNSYNANLRALKQDEDSSVAISKTLRDVAIIEGITAAIGSFEQGGIVGRDGFDNVRTTSNGITQGRSHNMKKGVLAYHQGGEGFWSREDVAAVGGDSEFYKLKQAATSGSLDSNFFTPQSRDFIKSVPVQGNVNEGLISEVRELKKAIRNQPHSTSVVGEVTDQFFEVIDKTIKGNKVKRTITRVQKKRL